MATNKRNKSRRIRYNRDPRIKPGKDGRQEKREWRPGYFPRSKKRGRHHPKPGTRRTDIH